MMLTATCIHFRYNISGSAWALDEAILTPTNDSAKYDEEKAFKAAMDVWNKHILLLILFQTECLAKCGISVTFML